jgi:hypothetical protein
MEELEQPSASARLPTQRKTSRYQPTFEIGRDAPRLLVLDEEGALLLSRAGDTAGGPNGTYPPVFGLDGTLSLS